MAIKYFNYDLKQGWNLEQRVNDEGQEIFTFSNKKQEIVLYDESVKSLRYIFKKINTSQLDY